jgi:preprotein translocase subunit SecE
VTESPNKVVRWGGQTIGFLKACRQEWDKVTWPTRDELTKATRMIVILSVVLGLVIGLLDWTLNLVLVQWLARLTA